MEKIGKLTILWKELIVSKCINRPICSNKEKIFYQFYDIKLSSAKRHGPISGAQGDIWLQLPHLRMGETASFTGVYSEGDVSVFTK